jgi:AcrR family transcriptional regulator
MPYDRSVTTRGDRTREQIINAAELLFAERGLLAVSLREINVAAGQRNTAALHYHFNGRAGVVSAIAAKHLPRIDARQHDLLVKLVESGEDEDLRSLVDAVLRPQVEYLELGPSERAWVKIAASWVARPAVTNSDMNSAGTTTGRDLRRRWIQLLRRDMPTLLARERVLMTYTAALHGLADRARSLDSDTDRASVPAAAFAANLCDMVCGALTAPVSPAAAGPYLDIDLQRASTRPASTSSAAKASTSRRQDSSSTS